MGESETVTLGLDGGITPATAGPLFLPREIVANRFRVVRLLGQGGMAQVYEAEDLELGQSVALKVMRPELAASGRARELLKSEALMARQVTHANVCRIFDVFQHAAAAPEGEPRPRPDTLVLVMELLRGETLAQRLARGGPLTPMEALPIIRQLAEALDAAHRSRVVHGDFKSGNVILEPSTSGPRAVVTDFGLARHAAAGGGCAGGTTAYMAPEQLQRGEVTAASDLYALGVVILEMLHGRRPAAERGSLTALDHFSVRFPRRSALRSAPPEWREPLRSCLAQAPRDRPASAVDVARSLATAVAPRPPATAPAPRRRRRFSTLAAALVLLPACLALGTPSRRPADRAGAPSLGPLEGGTGAPAARLAVAIGSFADRSPPPLRGSAWLEPALGHLVLSEMATGGRVEAWQLAASDGLERLSATFGGGSGAAGAAGARAPAGAGGGAGAAAPGSRFRLPADLVTSGWFALSPDGGAIRIALEASRLSSAGRGEVVTAIEESGRLADIAGIVGRLGTRLRRVLGLPPPTPEDRAGARALRPATLAAEGFYAQGVSLLCQGRLPEAAAALGRALAADPAFSLSHAALARTWADLDEYERARQEAQRAMELADRLPEPQRMEVSAVSRRLHADLSGAAGLFGALWRGAPHDADYGVQRAESQLEAGLVRAALETLRQLRAIGIDPALAPWLDLLEARALFLVPDVGGALQASLAAEEGAKRAGNLWVLAAAELVEADARVLQEDLPAGARVVAMLRDLDRKLGLRELEAEVLLRQGVLDIRAGKAQQAIAWTERAIAVFDEEGATRRAATARARLGRLHFDRRELAAATEPTVRSLADFRKIGDLNGQALALDQLALLAIFSHDPARAVKLLEDVVSLTTETGNRRGLLAAHLHLGTFEADRGELHAAELHFEESVRLSRELGLRSGEAMGLGNLGDVRALEGDLHAAGTEYLETLRLAHQAHMVDLEAYALAGIGGVLRQEERFAPAEKALRRALALVQDHADTQGELIATVLRFLAEMELWEARPAQAEQTLRPLVEEPRAGGGGLEQGDPGGEATSFGVLATVLAAQGKLAAARRAADRAAALAQASQGDSGDGSALMWAALAAARVDLGAHRSTDAEERIDRALHQVSSSPPTVDMVFEARLLRAAAQIDSGRAGEACADLRALAAQAQRQNYRALAHQAARLLESAGGTCRMPQAAPD